MLDGRLLGSPLALATGRPKGAGSNGLWQHGAAEERWQTEATLLVHAGFLPGTYEAMC